MRDSAIEPRPSGWTTKYVGAELIAKLHVQILERQWPIAIELLQVIERQFPIPQRVSRRVRMKTVDCIIEICNEVLLAML